jgi:parallel beta-helix repeat protein
MKARREAFVLIALAAVASLLVANYVLYLHPQRPTRGNPPAKHPRILITDAAEFTVPGAGTGCECVTRGSGSFSDPFTISGWTLNASDGEGISIAKTTVHFLIRNVVVNGSSQYSGIVLRWVENGAIMNSSILGALDGISLYRSNSVLIANNTLIHNDFGILLEGSNNNTVTENTLDGSRQVGIFVRGSNNTVDANLVINGSFGGINVDGTALFGSSNTITRNIVKANFAYGIALWQARSNVIDGNIVSENGGAGIMLVDSSASNLVEYNRVVNNGGDGVLIAQKSSGNTASRNNVTGNGNGATTFDLHEESSDNLWLSNAFNTRSPDTIS